jgi:hypothetical protein
MKTTEDLARSIVRSKHWRWMPGMRNGLDGSRYMGDGRWARAWDDAYLHDTRKGSWPDLDDPCTLGGLLALVREAWDDQTIAARFSDEHGHWVVDGNRFSDCALCCDTEAEALVAALRAAPACDYRGVFPGCHSLSCPVHGGE